MSSSPALPNKLIKALSGAKAFVRKRCHAKESLFRIFCFATGLAGAAVLFSLTHRATVAALAAPIRVSAVKAIAAQAPPAAAAIQDFAKHSPSARLPIEVASVSEEKTQRDQMVESTEQAPHDSPQATQEGQTTPAQVEQMPSLALNQPGIQPGSGQEAVQAGPEAGSVGPALPEFVLAKYEKSGGSVVVIGLLVDDRNVVVDSMLLVGSSKPLFDLTLLRTYIGRKWGELYPPMSPGEKRWLEIRVDYDLNRKLQQDPLIP